MSSVKDLKAKPSVSKWMMVDVIDQNQAGRALF